MKQAILSVFLLVCAVALFYGVWRWGFCRIYVPPNRMAVIVAKRGEPLDEEQILARPGQRGILAEPLAEGRHFRNPVFFDHEIVPAVIIPAGKVGVVTSKVGDKLTEGEFIAERGSKGIWRSVLGPGKYRLNPYGYTVEIIDAISIPIGYAGVITSLSGKPTVGGAFARADEKGVRLDVLQPGLYYVNPKEFKIDVLEIGVNQVSLVGQDGGKVVTKARQLGYNEALNVLQTSVLEKQDRKREEYVTRRLSESRAKQAVPQGQRVDFRKAEAVADELRAFPATGDLGLTELVAFPSRDGFQISLDMSVEFELAPDRIAGIFAAYGDLPAVVDKIIMPQITSISRNKGSEYGAKDFIVGAGREKFQEDLTQSLEETLGKKDIKIHNALIRHVEVPDEIRTPIQQASIAIEQDLTNKERQNTARKMAELNTELSLIEQRRGQVQQETEKLKAEIAADLQRQVATIRGDTLKKVAEIEKETAAVHADKVRVLGRAEAAALERVKGERAKGLQMKTAVFGDPLAYSLWQFAEALNPEIKFNILHAGEGTLWTDLEHAGLEQLGGASMLRKK